MPLIHRHDLVPDAALGTRESHRRLLEFRREISRSHDAPIAWLVRLLPPSSRRGNAASRLRRRFFRSRVPSVTPSLESGFFHQNSLDPTTSKSLVGSIDEVEIIDSSLPLAEINARIMSGTLTWVFLSPDSSAPAAATMAYWLSGHEGADVIFADSKDPTTGLISLRPPQVGPHTLLSYNVVGECCLLRREALRARGLFDEAAGVAYLHDFFLRVSESRGIFRHIPVIVEGETPLTGIDAAILTNDTIAVVRKAFARRGLRATVASGPLAGTTNWLPELPLAHPRVDIVIPTRDRRDLLERCIASIRQQSTYDNYRIIILDNDSKDPATLEYFASTEHEVVPCPGAFNYAAIMNRGVSHSSADFVVTLNNDTTIETADWLERLVALASLEDVGVVGVQLREANGKSEHEGIVMVPYPQHLRSDGNYPRRDEYIQSLRDVIAVTGACQIIARSWWQELGGMDEEMRVVMNDIDLCLRSLERGRFVLYDPRVVVTHAVGSSRGSLDPLADRSRFIARWDVFGSFVDPFFPSSLRLLGETFFHRPAVSVPPLAHP